MILFCGRAFGTDCDSMLSQRTPSCVETQNAYLSYTGNAISVDSKPGHIVGNIHLKVGVACLYEDNPRFISQFTRRG